ncbi:MAG: hypothetical protein J6P13_02245 [Kiritimatiellae bacterium]|nr:hypothetical protein [Kiritimatiellia bacterium]
MEINFTTALPGGVEPKNGKYHCKVAHNRVIAPDEVAEDMAKKLHIDPLQAQLYLATVLAYIERSVEDGESINFGSFSLYISMKGTVEGANGDYDPEANALALNLRAGAKIKKALSTLKPVNATLEPDEKPAITRIADTSLKNEGVISGEPDAEVVITGRNLAMDSSALEKSDGRLLRMEGVRLESKDGETVATGRVLEACTNVVRVKFDAAIPPGAYRIVIVTRNHRGPRTNPAVAKRELQVGS